MKKLDRKFQSLVESASRESTPHGDITGPALARIRQRIRQRENVTRPMAVFAAAYGLICVTSLTAGYLYLGIVSNPMSSLFAMASGITP